MPELIVLMPRLVVAPAAHLVHFATAHMELAYWMLAAAGTMLVAALGITGYACHYVAHRKRIAGDIY